MSKNEKRKPEFEDFVCNPSNYMESLRKNIFMLLDYSGMTLRELSEQADMPFETLKSFLYGNSKDCKLSTIVKIAKALNTSIDELVGAETINTQSRESLFMCRNIPDYVLYLVRSFIRHQYKLHSQFDEKSINIPVLCPQCVQGYLPTTNITSTVCIDHLSDEQKAKIVLGIQIPCEHYEPYYMPHEIILLAADREGLDGERCVVSYKGHYFFALKRYYVENGKRKWKYISMLDSTTEIFINDIDDKIGYIVGYLNPDHSWGIR